jgi:dTDP-4-dehydrorhamnose 3,5-epimerase
MSDVSGSARLLLHPTLIDGVMEVEHRTVGDHRGALRRLFDATELEGIGFPAGPVQINLVTTSVAGTVRGLHLQDAGPDGVGETKLITCVQGRAYDVAVDLRPDSPTRYQHHHVVLEPELPRSMLIPPGVAHGMQALEDRTVLLYLHSVPHRPLLERGVRPDDPALAIRWPIAAAGLSERDRSHPLLPSEAGHG